MTLLKKRISFIGSVALLVSSMTGPGLVTIPILFQSAGWLTSILTLITVTLLSGAASLLLCETLSSVVGNEQFQRQIEFSSLATILISDPKKRIFIQITLFISIQSVNIASILISAQSMDTLLVSLAGRSCGIGIHPRRGPFCVYEPSHWNSPFGDDYMVVTAGYLITLAMVLPLGLMDLVDNIKFQIRSDQSRIIGTVLFNYAFVTTIPSWVNDMGSTVSIRKSVWYSATISTIAYILLGILGGMAYKMDATSNIIAVINASKERSIVSVVTTYLFPLAVLIASIPVYTIVVRYNLQRTGQCGKVTTIILSTILPWTIVIPFQTGYWLNTFTNWTSIIFTSTSNFILPFYFYYLNEKRRRNTKVANEVDDAFSIKTTGRSTNDGGVCASSIIRSPKSAKSLSPPVTRRTPLSRSPSINSVRSITNEDKYLESSQTTTTSTIIRAVDTEQNNINEKSETRSYNNLSLAPPVLESTNHRRSLSAPYSLMTSSTTAISNSVEVKQPYRPKLHLEIPPILTRRTSSSCRQSLQIEQPPSPPFSPSVVPIITVKNDDGIAVIVDLSSSHNSSNIEISNNDDNNGMIVMNTVDKNQLDSFLKKFDDEQQQHRQHKSFKAFPISTRNSVICAKIGGAFSVFLVGGIIFYDFLQLAMGNNVWH
ncbi:5164_t:CDS:2 [Ambispora gerdemannii]|uniref:5164_t:CDS:1 n=1 Tax=Ambispora gerdemannii TaxID=144530 RepID=A0A9N9G9Y5_9GLOM|nr:5164_t:CDS:2 [Ambispora gerdemannii]